MRNKLKLLIFITGLAGIGVILLQLNWLQRSYKASREKFDKDIHTVMLQSVLFAHALEILPDSTLKHPHVILSMSALSSSLSDMGESVDLSFEETDSLESSSSANFSNLLVKPQFVTAYKEFFKNALQKRNINILFEMALFNNKGLIVPSTTDTNIFKKLPVKIPKKSTEIRINHDYYVQLAFPEVMFYLLKQMIWELIISIVLILIFLISFIYMVRVFFRQKRLSEVKSDFMNNMTHELKTPISSVSIALEFIQNESFPSSAKKEYAQIAQNELKRLTILVEKVLRMAAFEKSEIKINPEKINATAWINDIISANKPILETKNAIINCDIRLENTMIWMDKVHFANVMQNLLDNALKYNNKHQPIIDISMWEDGQSLYISMTDNGRGIPEKHINNIFDKFFRVPTKDMNEIKGYGLGLSYVKAVADLHKGNISVKSKISEGTTFSISIPKL